MVPTSEANFGPFVLIFRASKHTPDVPLMVHFVIAVEGETV